MFDTVCTLKKQQNKVDKSKLLMHTEREVIAMIFTQQRLVFRIIDVFHIHQENARFEETDRHFSSLSFRLRSDAVIHTKNETIQLGDGAVSFFPADVDYRREASVDDLYAIDMEVDNYASDRIEWFLTADPEAVGKQFREIHHVWTSGRMDRFYRANALLYALFAELYGEGVAQDDGMPALLCRAIEYLDRHFAKPELSVTEVARHVGVSEVYLRHLFRQYRQCSPKQYLTDVRIRKAKALLSSGFYSVSQTAQKCGFRDDKYFSTHFKRLTGITPSQYKYRPEPSHRES